MYPRVLSILLALFLPLLATAQSSPVPAATQPLPFADISALARTVSTVEILRTVRAVTQLYALQHDNKYPALADMADWTILLRQTDKEGHLNPPATVEPKFGPYLHRLPANALTGHSKLREIGHVTPDAGWIWDTRGSEPLIFIAMPAQSEPIADYLVACNLAIRCPEIPPKEQPFSVGRAAGLELAAGMSPGAMESFPAKLQLEIARAHLALAVPQTQSFYPTLDQMSDWRVLLAPPGEGSVTPGKPPRPSLPHALGNPLRNNATRIVAAGTADSDPGAGWTYSPTDGRLRIVIPADFTPHRTLPPEDVERLQPQKTK